MYTKCFTVAQDLLRQILALRSPFLGSGSLLGHLSHRGLKPWVSPPGGPCSPVHGKSDSVDAGGCHPCPFPGGSGVLDPGWAWEGEHQSGGVPCKQIWPVSGYPGPALADAQQNISDESTTRQSPTSFLTRQQM